MKCAPLILAGEGNYIPFDNEPSSQTCGLLTRMDSGTHHQSTFFPSLESIKRSHVLQQDQQISGVFQSYAALRRITFFIAHESDS